MWPALCVSRNSASPAVTMAGSHATPAGRSSEGTPRDRSCPPASLTENVPSQLLYGNNVQPADTRNVSGIDSYMLEC